MGNLALDITEEKMRKLFEKYGKAGDIFIRIRALALNIWKHEP